MNASHSNLLLAAFASATLAACQGGGEGGNQGGQANGIATAGSASASGGAGAQAASPGATIGQTLSQSADHSTLMSAVKAAGLTETLSGAGPYTVFAPTNAAFAKLPAGTTEGLIRPESKAALIGILTYHVVPGVVTSKDLASAMQRRGGKTQLATVGGGTLTLTQVNGGLTITDGKNGTARVTGADMIQSNGVVHAVDAVLMPK